MLYFILESLFGVSVCCLYLESSPQQHWFKPQVLNRYIVSVVSSYGLLKGWVLSEFVIVWMPLSILTHRSFTSCSILMQ